MNEIHSERLLGPLLRDVSRSFYLTLRVLPREIRPQISLAYLLARATDTIADTKAVPRAKRMHLLRQMQALTTPPDLGAVAEQQTSPAEAELLRRLDECFGLLDQWGEGDARLIQELLRTIISGQMFDLEKFPGETEAELAVLQTDAELDEYTYKVAGCVGEFWTKICMAHLPQMKGWDRDKFIRLGVRFGKGLQLVNILRDMPADLKIGRCYLPLKDPRALQGETALLVVKPMFDKWREEAIFHLEAGWQYTMGIPTELTRLRLACVWPIWIGLRTLALMKLANPLSVAERVKVTRGEVYGMMARSVWWRGNPARLDAEYQRLLKQARSG